MSTPRLFPVLHPPKGCVPHVQWDALSNTQALKVHYQTLERLAERGGLCPTEIFWNVNGYKWGVIVPIEDAVALTNSLAPEPLLPPDPKGYP